MNGELAQIVVLTSFGNAFLHDMLTAEDETSLRKHPILCQQVRTIQFHNAEAQDPSAAAFDWFQALRNSRAKRLWLTTFNMSGELQPHIAEAFANAMPRGVGVILPEGPIIFVPKWHFERGQKWIVTYKAYQLPESDVPSLGNVTASICRLQDKIIQVREFATNADQGHWARWFDEALQALQTGESKTPYLPTCGYSRYARRLLAGATSAWVFGGMGSWNDIWFQDESLQPEYERITRELYDAVSGGIAAATNAFDENENSI